MHRFPDLAGRPASESSVIFVVDGDCATRAMIGRWLAPLPYRVVDCTSGEQLLVSPELKSAVCLLCDIRPPGIGVMEIRRQMETRGIVVPTIVLAGDADIATAVQLMRGGAVDLLEKPLVGRQLVTRVRELVL